MLGLCLVPRDDSGFSAAKALCGDPLCLNGEFLDSDELPPPAFQDRIQCALRGLVLPPPHHWPTSTAVLPGTLASEDYVMSERMLPFVLCRNSTKAPTES